jgi:hypothetical protein
VNPNSKSKTTEYQVPEGEENVFHAIIERKQFDAATGTRQSIPRLQKFEFKSFKEVLKNLKLQGFTVDIVYNPTDFVKEEIAHKASMKKKRATDQQDRKAERLEAEREELKAEIRKEIEAEAKKKKETKK